MQSGRWNSSKTCSSALHMDCTTQVIKALSRAKSSRMNPQTTLNSHWQLFESRKISYQPDQAGIWLYLDIPIVIKLVWDLSETVLSTAWHRAKCSMHNASSVSGCSQLFNALYVLWATAEERAMTTPTPGSQDVDCLRYCARPKS